ncbi:Rha family transcriptional regulator [Desulfovibrio gilichinskyi]|uniref:Phage regulatory protein, rha family n=1 Tax=Desulfovibrio gilichinskyi TaxID=1519643 RepID=A0A1X7CGI5_9BACT|nr:Rha family transcriptional regulator [Desulfovibrio gilichinskyi]SME96202.1 phage regulatory protein, rha family [Desulfovibrio gilichinskyi]
MAEKNLANSHTSDNSSVVSSPTLAIADGKPVVSSLTIAEHFGKRHDDVLKKIKQLDIPDDFGLRNFAESSYVNAQNKEMPCYNLTRDGFAYLVMGFTGKKASAWKIRYLEAFNTMEEELLRIQNKTSHNQTIQAISDCLIRDNTVHAFINEACEIASWGRVSKTELYQYYKLFCERNDELAMHRARFFADLYSMLKDVRETRPRIDGHRCRMLLGIAPYPQLDAPSKVPKLPAPKTEPEIYGHSSPKNSIATAKTIIFQNLEQLPRAERQAMLMAYDALIEAEQVLSVEAENE